MPLKLLLEKTGVVGYINMHPLMELGEPYMWDALHTLKLLKVLGYSQHTKDRAGGSGCAEADEQRSSGFAQNNKVATFERRCHKVNKYK